MTKEQSSTIELVQRYISSLDNHLTEIIQLNGANSGFTDIQNAYADSLFACIDKAKRRIHEVKNGAVWDNLVIAFFGETNAGKSTIIETFRILFGEKERTSNLRKNPGGVDGLIVGTGMSDCTQVYKEYKMNISGVPFTLIDVPGIEGNEAVYEKEIKEALQKAHYVFYVQGQNKKPDTGTAGKIKKYLREWVKVYSIYNVRGVASNYDEETERVSLLSDSERKIEAQIKSTFQEVLGHTYMGNISIQAYLAMCAKAKFAPSRMDLQRGQKKLLSYFGNSQSIYQFSQFDSLVNVVNQKAKNFTKEIVEANKEKHKAMLLSMCSSLSQVTNSQAKAINKLESLLDSFQSNIKQDYANAERQISRIADYRYDQIFSEISDMAMSAIENDVGDKEKYCKRKLEKITSQNSRAMQNDISSAIRSLNETIQKRKKELDQSIATTHINVSNASISMSLNFTGALDKLDFNLGDFANLVFGGVGTYGLFVFLSNFWNPLGWAGAAFSVLVLLFGGRDKKAEAKEKMRENIQKAKDENRNAFIAQINRINQSLGKTGVAVVEAVDGDRQNLTKLRYLIQKVNNSIQIEYSKLNISNYGSI